MVEVGMRLSGTTLPATGNTLEKTMQLSFAASTALPHAESAAAMLPFLQTVTLLLLTVTGLQHW